jgi:hypothetical protein
MQIRTLWKRKVSLNQEFFGCKFSITQAHTKLGHNFYSKTNQMHNISNLFYFGTTLYMFRTVSVHHQESKAVHTASYHTGSVATCQQAATESV